MRKAALMLLVGLSVGVFGGPWSESKFADNSVAFKDSENIDAFGRLRTSHPTTLFESSFDQTSKALFWDTLTTGGATIVHQQAKAARRLTVPASPNARAVLESHPKSLYNPGKSLVICMTVVFGEPVANVTRSAGFYDNQDGVFLRQPGGELELVIRSSVSGVPLETAVPQSRWNLNRFDGARAGVPVLDPSKIQILWMDLEWLGAGRVRTGFVIGGQIIYAHEFSFANVSETVYMQTAKLPVRYEIATGVSAPSGEAYMDAVCSAVFSEGGEENLGMSRSLDTGDVPVPVAAATTQVVLAARVGSSVTKSRIGADEVILAVDSTAVIRWRLVLNGTIPGSVSWTPVSTGISSVEKGSGMSAGAITGGVVLHSGWLSTGNFGGNLGGVPTSLLKAHYNSLTGVGDTLAIEVRNFEAQSRDIYASLNLREIF